MIKLIAKLLNCFIAREKNNNCFGFTLIELLIVIAVLGVLAAGVIVAINPLAKINSANLAKAKTFAASIENNLSVNQVGKWSFEETASPSKDTSGYGNNGNWNGGTTWNNAATCGLGFGGCLSFNGTSSYVDVPDSNSLDIANEITMVAWIRPTSLPGDAKILTKDAAYIATMYISNYSFQLYIDGAFRFFTWPNLAQQGAWQHVAFSYNSSDRTGRFYFNGEAKVPIALNGLNSYIIGTSTSPLAIGSWSGGTVFFFNGLIDEVAIYSQALGLSQIQQLYAQGLVRHQLALK